MIGHIGTGNSFRKNIDYTLKDKLTHNRQVIYKDRAEIIYYHQCYGCRIELDRQFEEVAALNKNISKPSLHISFSFPEGECLSKSLLIQLAKECSEALDFEKHQYVVLLHKDTPYPHIHLVANRIGFDRQVSDNRYTYRKIVLFCRAAELRHGLIKELSPRCYLSEEQRQHPRHSLRLDKLKENIRQSLLISHDLTGFKTIMEGKGYIIYHSQRGIAFMDEKHVIFKGSEAGYSINKIQDVLSRDLTLRQQEERQRLEQAQRQQLQQEQGHRRHHHSQELSL